MEEAALWAACKSGDESARAALIERYKPLVWKTRDRIVPTVPVKIDSGDLDSEGFIGLVRAVDRFDPARGVKFSSFAIASVRGALRDYLRKEDWAPRSVWQKQKRLQSAEEALTLRGEAVTDASLADELGIAPDQLPRFQQDALGIDVVSYEARACFSDEGGREEENPLSDILADPGESPEEAVLGSRVREECRRAMARLPERERQVIWSRYWDEKTFAAIGQDLGRSESRVIQLHNQARARLGPWLQGGETGAMVEHMRDAGEAKRSPGRVNGSPGINPRDFWWTPEEDAILREQWGRAIVAEIAAVLGRDGASVARRAQKLGLGRFEHKAASAPIPEPAPPPASETISTAHIDWTPEEDEAITARYYHEPAATIAAEFQRSTEAVRRRARKLLAKGPPPSENGNGAHPPLPPEMSAGRAIPAVEPWPDPSEVKPPTLDPEVLAMEAMTRLFPALSARARQRVLAWARDRFLEEPSAP